MFVTEHLDRANKPLFSYEIIPPARGKSAKEILNIVEQVMVYRPPFIDVTSHPAEAYYDELGDGTIKRRIRKKRPGTISLCGIIQNRYNIDTVPHLLCRGFSREETEDAMIELNFLGIHNVLAIRGDESNYKKPMGSDRTSNVYSNELVEQLVGLKNGQYLDELAETDPMDICIGVGGHPEKHLESPNVKSDIKSLKRKIDAGGDYIVTQMFFENGHYFNFVKNCRNEKIDVPIIPGIKLLTGIKQLTSLPKHFHISFPDDLVDEAMASPKHVKEIGLRWGLKQCEELLNSGTRCIHFYIMNDAIDIINIIKKLV